jgi:ribosomal protein S19
VKLFVYNGKKFVSLLVSKEMLGHKFGEFVFTKRLGKTIHLIGKKSKKGKKLKKK